MLIEEKYIIKLRKGEKEAFKEVYNVYNDLYYFYFKYLIRNDEWINELIVSFYHELYNNINDLKENTNFEFWSLMLIKKCVRNFFKKNERFSKLSNMDIDEIISFEHPFIPINNDLSNKETAVIVFSFFYKIKTTIIGKLLDIENSKVLSIKRKIKKNILNNNEEEAILALKKDFHNLYIAKINFEDIIKGMEFIEKKPGSDIKIQGSTKSLIIFILIIIMILITYAIIIRTGACDNSNNIEQNLFKIIKRSLL